MFSRFSSGDLAIKNLIVKRSRKINIPTKIINPNSVGISSDNVPVIASDIIKPGRPKNPNPAAERNFEAKDEISFSFPILSVIF